MKEITIKLNVNEIHEIIFLIEKAKYNWPHSPYYYTLRDKIASANEINEKGYKFLNKLK